MSGSLSLLLVSPFIGSFLGVLICRLPLARPVVMARCKCDICGHSLAAWELIPLASYAALRGRCRACHKSIARFHVAIGPRRRSARHARHRPLLARRSALRATSSDRSNADEASAEQKERPRFRYRCPDANPGDGLVGVADERGPRDPGVAEVQAVRLRKGQADEVVGRRVRNHGGCREAGKCVELARLINGRSGSGNQRRRCRSSRPGHCQSLRPPPGGCRSGRRGCR